MATGDWDDSWPAAQICGLTTLRLLILPGPKGQDGDHDLGWQIFADSFARNSERGLLLTGEIIQPTGDWFVTAAGRVLVRFQPDVAPDLESDDALDEALKRFGSWASHILWDHCRGVLLQASSSFPFEFSLPTITPRPVLVTKAMQREAEAPDPD
ncbi:hypothetical protein GII30_19515 [Gordonia amarae]|uniref:Uncharacterized protein n=2 Tax=Gordonia amarae TaxID=36821 RepID=G7GKI9_9ACTN|nr:hypothetical protein [Gordonia amarae]MCS3880627.1 hypothetical protein [Gordonia amarae]QHN18934.1 hypothetical protein GII35_19870 [Gordonia amarae]QHN23409.1 hypothetical protein GII34_19370 [Gordonia amarae]QHN32310.1 hypothetical protein GII32_19685 [Gordonia amarae]QHN41058.1 hypothetical protein GII30_19515 [Gordonia amarae]